MRRAWIITAILVFGACSSKQPPPPPPPTDGIELVNAGTEPRQLLRYKLTQNADTPLEVSMDVDMRTLDRTVALPSLVLALDLVPTNVDANGAAKMKASVTGGSARARGEPDPALVRVMERQAQILVGLVTTFDLSPSGQVSNTKIAAANRDLSEPLQKDAATLTQLSDQLSMALPDKPIGAGAIWKHRRTMKQNQLTLVTMTTVEVTAIEGDKVTFKSTTEITGADQAIAQGSATAQVTAIRGTGTQTGMFDLSKAIVVGTSTATLTFELVADGQRRPNKMEVVTHIGPRLPPPAHEASDAGTATDDAGVSVDAGVVEDPTPSHEPTN